MTATLEIITVMEKATIMVPSGHRVGNTGRLHNRDLDLCTICGKRVKVKSITFTDGSGVCQACFTEYRDAGQKDRHAHKKKR